MVAGIDCGLFSWFCCQLASVGCLCLRGLFVCSWFVWGVDLLLLGLFCLLLLLEVVCFCGVCCTLCCFVCCYLIFGCLLLDDLMHGYLVVLVFLAFDLVHCLLLRRVFVDFFDLVGIIGW